MKLNKSSARHVFAVCVSMYECLCECFFSIALSRSLHRLLGCLEPICCRGHVGCFRRRHAGSSRCIRPCRRVCQVFHHLQPSGLPAVQAQLSRVSLQRHVHVTTEDLPGKSTLGSERTFRFRLAAQQGHEHLHALLKWTAGELWGVSALHGECSAVSCDRTPEDCLHPDWIHLQRGDS